MTESNWTFYDTKVKKYYYPIRKKDLLFWVLCKNFMFEKDIKYKISSNTIIYNLEI